MDLIDLGALDACELQTDPFDYIVVPDFLPPENLKRVNADYPAIDTATNHDLRHLAYGPQFAKFISELQTDTFRTHLGKKFGVDLSGCPTTTTVRKFCERTDGHIHTDHKSKVITVLVYFNDQEWNTDGGCLRILRSSSSLEDYTAEVKPLGGRLLAFHRTDWSWHGHKKFVGERRMLQYNFLSRSKLAQLDQKISRVGTHIGKRVLGLR
ncbi:MAG: 2OG-Fe(II) oxygenase [Pseudomonadales bacterium]|nr:2OG-Fe(II) oxygenase [Halioglobus sp.]MCP5123394.1 2OG-Fe(II) oxygenase [Pseudomonadales bacterium]MCP5193044.1 2OG-Fe(II) oxygenase [Pseudomonadales bacterium]